MNHLQDQRNQLAAKAALGDRLALEALCRTIWYDVRRLCLVQLGNSTLADDAAQESLVLLVRNIHRYDSDRPFGPWLRTLVRNQCRSLVRKQAARPTVGLESEPAGSSPDPSWALDLDEGARSALAEFAALTPRQREVMELCDRGGMAPSEAADEMNIAQGTARSLLYQARSALRARLLKHRPELLDLVRAS